jgi:ComF family protein
MNVIYDLWDDFLSLLFPRLCCGCGNHLLRNEAVICTECFIAIPRTGYHQVKDNPVESLFWGRCRIERGAAFSYYNRGSRIRRIIHCLKYKGIKEAGTELGKIYGASLKSSEFLCGIDFILPVPLHPDKERKRGFNQAKCIAEGISSVTGLAILDKSLVRIKSSDSQTKRSRYDRWMNVDGIFEATDNLMLTGKHILIVDDVITTGSTLEACASAMLKIEGVKVSVAALAVAVQ